MFDTYGIWTALAWCALVFAVVWIGYLRIQRPTVGKIHSIVSIIIIIFSLVGILGIKQSMLPVGILCCAIAVTGVRNTKIAAITTLAVVVALNYLQTLEPSWEINTSSHDPAIVAIVGFLFMNLRISRVSHRRLQEELYIAEQNQELREQNLQAEFRTQIAANLHDLIGHDLTVINIRLQQLVRTLKPLDSDVAYEARAIQKMTRSSIAHLRDVVEGFNTVDFSHQLNAIPSLLSYRGIQAHMDIQQNVLKVLNPSTLTALYWVLLEAITNVLKHSGAKNCWVSLKQHSSGDYMLIIADDGIGLKESSMRNTGAGLADMNTRIQHIGGETTLGAAPEGGTQVRARIPASNIITGGA